MADSININIKSSGENKYAVNIDPGSTVQDLKKAVETELQVPIDRQRLIYSGKVLKDLESILSYKIKLGDTVHLVKSAAAKLASAVESTLNNASLSAAALASIPTNITAGQGAFNPLAGLTGARYAGYTQLPLASLFGPDGGMNSTFDPDNMSEMMSSPMFQQSMNAMLSDPQMMDYLISQNPHLRAMGPHAREMMQSPVFRQMLTNPEMMRQMMSMGGGIGSVMPDFPAPGANPNLETPQYETARPASHLASNVGMNNTPANPFASLFPGGALPMDAIASLMANSMPGVVGNSTASIPPVQDTRPPEERYESQLRQLNDMGFFDFDANVTALRRTGGSVQGAVEQLLNN